MNEYEQKELEYWQAEVEAHKGLHDDLVKQNKGLITINNNLKNEKESLQLSIQKIRNEVEKKEGLYLEEARRTANKIISEANLDVQRIKKEKADNEKKEKDLNKKEIILQKKESNIVSREKRLKVSEKSVDNDIKNMSLLFDDMQFNCESIRKISLEAENITKALEVEKTLSSNSFNRYNKDIQNKLKKLEIEKLKVMAEKMGFDEREKDIAKREKKIKSDMAVLINSKKYLEQYGTS